MRPAGFRSVRYHGCTTTPDSGLWPGRTVRQVSRCSIETGGLIDQEIKEALHAGRGMDLALQIGSRALLEDDRDVLQLSLTAELLRGTIDGFQALAAKVACRNRLAAAVEELGFESVAGRLKARLGECLPCRNIALVALCLDPTQAVHESSEGAHAPQIELRVGGANLDRSQGGMDARVPPDVGVVVEAPGRADLARHPAVMLEVVELRRHRRARIAAKDHRPRARQAGVLAEPERRIRGERVEQRDVGADAVVRANGGPLVGHPDVNVLAADWCAKNSLQGVLDQGITRSLADVGFPGRRVGMEPGAHQAGARVE